MPRLIKATDKKTGEVKTFDVNDSLPEELVLEQFATTYSATYESPEIVKDDPKGQPAADVPADSRPVQDTGNLDPAGVPSDSAPKVENETVSHDEPTDLPPADPVPVTTNDPDKTV